MNIFHIIDSAGIYGAEMVLLNLLQEQLRMGLNPLLCSIGDLGEQQKPLEDAAELRGIKVCRLRLPRGLKFKSSFAIMSEVRNSKADIIHLHGYKDTILVGLLPRLFRKIPTIRTLHGWTSKTRWSKIWLYETLDRFCLKRIDGIVSVNEMLVDQVQRYVKKVPILPIENGIPPLHFARERIIEEEDELAGFCQDAFVIGGIGRFSKEKGFIFLLKAISILTAKRPEIKLILIGEGEQQQEMDNIIQAEGLAKHVFFAGYKQNAARYLPLFDLFVMPSLTEGLPIVLLEAMQAGVPVVATEVGGVPMVLGQGEYGELVEPGNHESLAHAMMQAIDNNIDALSRARKAKEIALNRYSSERMAGNYLEFYNSVLNSRDLPLSEIL